MRRFLPLIPLAIVLALPACSGGEGPEATADSDGRIDCRIGSDSQFQRYCTLARTPGEGGTILTLNKPDGGFRRLQVTQDGRGVIAADGAEHAEVTIIGPNLIEVAIAGDRFRLPARVGTPAAPAAANTSNPATNSL